MKKDDPLTKKEIIHVTVQHMPRGYVIVEAFRWVKDDTGCEVQQRVRKHELIEIVEKMS
jgi:hypothetical protein